MGKYYTEVERIKIETLLNNGYKPKEIAVQLNRHYTSVYREIKRGTVELLDTHLKPYKKYCADVGQRKMKEVSHNKGIDIKIKNDNETLDYIENLIRNKRYSPYAVSIILNNSDGHTRLSKGTIYNYIHNGVFPHMNEKNLLYKIKPKKEKVEKRPKYNKSGMKSIEERSKEILKRDSFGHWEMDTVYSGKDKSKSCLLVLSERMTRHEKIYKLKDRKAQSVLDKINDIEKSLGTDKFKAIFKSITCDNGVEFSKHKEIETSCKNGKDRTVLYFCHPFASCERGTNENENKLIRKYIPKGDDISKYSDEQIRGIENIINHYPRKLFDGLSSIQFMYNNNLASQII